MTGKSSPEAAVAEVSAAYLSTSDIVRETGQSRHAVTYWVQRPGYLRSRMVLGRRAILREDWEQFKRDFPDLVSAPPRGPGRPRLTGREASCV